MIILSIPFLSKIFIQETTEKYRFKFDYLEFRLDHHKNLSEFPESLINKKTIITIRDISEGGINKIPFSEKIKYYKKVVSEHDCLVDLEINCYQKKSINPDNLILSYHNFSESYDFEKLLKVIKLSNSLTSKFLKIAINMDSYTDLIKIHTLISKSNKPVIVAGMGKLGKISRVLFQHLGAFGTFSGLENSPTANGQLTIQESERYNLRNISQNTKIGGIIGGKQVENSLGLKFYNNYFQKNKLDAAYLPFVVEDPDDFWKWMGNSPIDFYGFSVTMPFKKEIGDWKQEIGKSGFAAFRPDKQEEEFSISNFYLPKSNEFLNTDLTAFIKSLAQLKINKIYRILIFGCGGTAETALHALKNFPNIFISARNEKNARELASKYNSEFKTKYDLSEESFDLIINCTPVGMNNEDFLKITNLKLPAKIIDLPYTDKKTPLIQKCEQKNIPFVDGKMFWKWQAEKQLEMFCNVVQNLL